MLVDETLEQQPWLEKIILSVGVSDLAGNESNVKITPLTKNEYLRAGGSQFFSGYTQLFFARPPWNERLICLRCKASDDFTGKGVFTDHGVETCTKHRIKLTKFWSNGRFSRYVSRYMRELRDDQVNGFIAWIGDIPVGWITGYELTADEIKNLGMETCPRVYYLDLLGTVPSVRRRRSRWRMIREALFVLKIRTSPIKLGIVDFIIKLTGLPIVGILYLRLLRSVYIHGFRVILTKTHVEDKSVRHLLNIAGFKEIGPDPSDPRLSFWRKYL